MIPGAAATSMVSSGSDPVPGINHDAENTAEQARSAVWVGVHVSAARCLLTYVIAPLAGTFGILLGPAGILLQVLGTITAVSGALRLWALGHRGRFVYAFVAVALVLITAVSLGQFHLGGPE
jgi:hypothetical protein